jgi:hypothetical protein
MEMDGGKMRGRRARIKAPTPTVPNRLQYTREKPPEPIDNFFPQIDLLNALIAKMAPPITCNRLFPAQIVLIVSIAQIDIIDLTGSRKEYTILPNILPVGRRRLIPRRISPERRRNLFPGKRGFMPLPAA